MAGGGDCGLPQLFRDLLPPTLPPPSSLDSYTTSVAVESSGCLSQCGRGPNVCVTRSSPVSLCDDRYFFGVDGPTMAAAVLEVGCDLDVPVNLLTAADVMVQANRATSPYKKEKLLTSAISALDSSPDLFSSPANSHVHAMRADARLAMVPPKIDGGLQDAKRAVDLGPDDNVRLWQVLASAEEAAGNIPAAMEAVSHWAEADPKFSTKARNEMSRLSSSIK